MQALDANDSGYCFFQPEESYGDQVTLKRATISLAGFYTCEVTTEYPSFHAVSGHGELRVVGKY